VSSNPSEPKKEKKKLQAFLITNGVVLHKNGLMEWFKVKALSSSPSIAK
jgi:hypothetical protein